MSKIAEVIGWKFNHQDGMSCRGEEIVQFPGGIPSQEDQDAWTAEFEARDKTEEMLAGKDQDILKMIEGLTNRVLTLEGLPPMTGKEFRDSLKPVINP